MKKISIFLVFCILSVFFYSCFPKKVITSNIAVSPLADTSVLRDGSLIYALPRTVFTIRFTMERTIEVPGPYAGYADELLSLDNAIKSEQEYWSIADVSVNSHEEVDPSEFYVIETNTSMETNALLLGKEGLILDVEHKSDYVEDSRAVGKELTTSQFVSYDLGSDEYYRTQVDTAYKRINIDSTFISVPYIVEKKKQLSTSQLAEKAAKRLIDLRDGKFLILTGEANVFPQSEAAINEINKMEKELTELFMGRTYTEKRVFTCQFIPDATKLNKPVTLFNFSELTGHEEINSAKGSPVSIIIMPEQKLKDISVISANTGATTGNDKLYYRIPDIANVKIVLDNEVLYNSRKMIYQLGEIIYLPSNYIIGK